MSNLNFCLYFSYRYHRQEGSWGGVLQTVLQGEGHVYQDISVDDQMWWYPTKLVAVKVESRKQPLTRRGKRLELEREKCSDCLWLFSSLKTLRIDSALQTL